MSDNVVDLPVVTTLETPPAKILARASAKTLTEVVVIGYEANGDFYFASSKADGGDVVWLMELAKKKLLEVGE